MQVAFKAFGLVEGSVGLRGKVERVPGSDDTVSVFFEPPRITLPGNISVKIGPKSSVVLSTPYVDERWVVAPHRPDPVLTRQAPPSPST